MIRSVVTVGIVAILMVCLASSVDAQKTMTVEEYLDEVVPAIKQAIIDGDLAALNKYHDLNPDAFSTVMESIPLLHAATEVGEGAIAEFLIAKGADVNRVKYGETPLDIACEWADHKLIEILILNGADKASRKRAWMTLNAMRIVFEQRDMTAGQRERNGVTRTITMKDIKLSLATLSKLGVTISG